MDIAIFSLIIGTVELLIGIPLILFPKDVSKWMLQLIRDDHLFRLNGAVYVVIASLTLTQGVRIGPDVAGLMQLVALIVFFKGIGACWWPEEMRRMSEWFLKSNVWRTIGGVLAVVFGILFLGAWRVLS